MCPYCECDDVKENSLLNRILNKHKKVKKVRKNTDDNNQGLYDNELQLDTYRSELCEVVQDYDRSLNLKNDVTFLQEINTEIKCAEQFVTGDVVSLKGSKHNVQIKDVNPILPNGWTVDYSGYMIINDFVTEIEVIFNQKDIECVVSKADNNWKNII